MPAHFVLQATVNTFCAYLYIEAVYAYWESACRSVAFDTVLRVPNLLRFDAYRTVGSPWTSRKARLSALLPQKVEPYAWLALSLSLSLSLSPPLSLFLSLSLSIYLSIYLSLSLSLPPPDSIPLSLSSSLPLSLYLSLCLIFSLSHSVCKPTHSLAPRFWFKFCNSELFPRSCSCGMGAEICPWRRGTPATATLHDTEYAIHGIFCIVCDVTLNTWMTYFSWFLYTK